MDYKKKYLNYKKKYYELIAKDKFIIKIDILDLFEIIIFLIILFL